VLFININVKYKILKIALIAKVSLPGSIHEKTLTIKKNIKKKQNISQLISDSDSDLDVELEKINRSKSVENEVTTEIIGIEPEENAVNTVVDKIIQSKPRGRPPKVPKALADSPTPIMSGLRKSNRDKKNIKYTK